MTDLLRADPDKPCPHEDFTAVVAVNRIVDPGQTIPKAYTADITAECAACGEKMRWIGLEGGASFSRPMVSVDETVLRAPLRPASSDPDFGMGLPGFAIRLREQ